MFCKQCGRPIDDGQELCEDCKVKFENTTTQEEPKSEPAQATNTSSTVQPTPKSKIAAGLLGIFIGSLGVHNFYLGYTGKSFAEKIVKTNHSYKGWLSTTTIPEDWFIRNGFRETKKIEGGYSNAKIVRVVPKEDPNKELDEFVKTLKLGIE